MTGLPQEEDSGTESSLWHGYLLTQDRTSMSDDVLGQLCVTWGGHLHSNLPAFSRNRTWLLFSRKKFKTCWKSLPASVLGRNGASNLRLQFGGTGGAQDGGVRRDPADGGSPLVLCGLGQQLGAPP